MPTLRETQLALAAALFDGDASVAAAIDGHGIAPLQRLAIYRKQVRGTFVRSLRLVYPTPAAILGDTAFDAIATSFMALHPSRSGDLHEIGTGFAEYLASGTHGAIDSHARLGIDAAVLADLARLDHARHHALGADDARPFDLARLATVAATELADSRLALHPSVGLLEVTSPTFALWRSCSCSTDERQSHSRGAARDSRARVLVHRVEPGASGEAHVVNARLIARASALFIEALPRTTLGEALDAAMSQDPRFDLAAELRRWIAATVIVDPG